MPASKDDEFKAIATNRRARHNFEIEQTFECGIALMGSEVKVLREGKASLADAYAQVRKGEVFLYGMNIPQYPQASMQNHDPVRARKLLLHKNEIAKITVKTDQQGYTLVPLRLYFKGNRVKAEIALARGKRMYDKRQTLMKREHEREIARGHADARKGR